MFKKTSLHEVDKISIHLNLKVKVKPFAQFF
jgi:hypothetical protein